MTKFKSALTHIANQSKALGDLDYSLQPLLIKSESSDIGKTIRESQVGQNYNGLVVGIERNGERILNPDSGTKIQSNDLLWIFGLVK